MFFWSCFTLTSKSIQFFPRFLHEDNLIPAALRFKIASELFYLFIFYVLVVLFLSLWRRFSTQNIFFTWRLRKIFLAFFILNKKIKYNMLLYRRFTKNIKILKNCTFLLFNFYAKHVIWFSIILFNSYTNLPIFIIWFTIIIT